MSCSKWALDAGYSISGSTSFTVGSCNGYEVSIPSGRDTSTFDLSAVDTSTNDPVESAFYSDANCSQAITQLTFSSTNSQMVYLRIPKASTVKLTAISGQTILSQTVNALYEFDNVTLLAGKWSPRGLLHDVGTDARFNRPAGMVAHGTDIYVVDANSRCVRRFSILTAQTEEFAGTCGESGMDNGVGSAARFRYPLFITRLGTSLYVTDNGGHTIREIDILTREVTTLAGAADGSSGATNGVGLAARFYNPAGITTDGTHLYVADHYNHLIRKIDPSDGTVTTLAGGAGVNGTANGTGTAARFDSPVGVASDGTYVYVADHVNYAIRRINIATGVVDTFAGLIGTRGNTNGVGAAARFQHLYGLSYSNGYLYGTEIYQRTVRKIEVATATVSTVIGSNMGVVNYDFNAGTLANGKAFLMMDTVEVGGDLYVSGASSVMKGDVANDYFDNFVGLSVSHLLIADGVGAAATIGDNYTMTTDGQFIYMVDYTLHVIRRTEILTGTVTTLAGLNGNSGNTDGIGTAARIRQPSNITYHAGMLYFTEYSHLVRSLNLTTLQVTTLAGTYMTEGSADGIGAAARFSYPEGLTYHNGFLYIADANNCKIRKLDLATNQVTTVAGAGANYFAADGIGLAAELSYPGAMATVGDMIYFVDAYAIRSFDPTSTEVKLVAGSYTESTNKGGPGANARFVSPWWLGTDGTNLYFPSGDIGTTVYKLDLSTNYVYELLTNRKFSINKDAAVTEASMLVEAITVTPTGQVFFSDGTSISELRQ